MIRTFFMQTRLCGLILSLQACITPAPTPSKNVNELPPAEQSAGQNKTQPLEGKNQIPGTAPVSPAVPTPIQLADDPCHPHSAGTAPPWYLPDFKIVINNVSNPCVTREGELGFRANSEYMAMGIPCSRGGGKISYEGHYYLPKIVSYIMSTDCPMVIPDRAALEKYLTGDIGLKGQIKLISLNPFALQYWELQDFAEADIGSAIELTDDKTLQKLWHRWKDGHGFSVKLYGRENSWFEDKVFYEVLGNLVPDGRNTYRLEIRQVQALDSAKEALVRDRCEALQPRRRCDAVF
jgi:hypothetical protein